MDMRRVEVTDVRSNSSGTYYTISHRTTGTLNAPTTVKHSKHGKFVCLTHLTADQCEHSQYVRQYVEARAAV